MLREYFRAETAAIARQSLAEITTADCVSSATLDSMHP